MRLFRRGPGKEDHLPASHKFRLKASDNGFPSWLKNGLSVSVFEGDEPLEVVGESFYYDELRRIEQECGREVQALLVPEPDNEHDPNAVSIWVHGLKVGHLNRKDAANYQAGVMRLIDKEGMPIALESTIVGGEPGRPNFGIWLRHDPEDFGLQRRRDTDPAPANPQEQGGSSTGSRAAELAWMERFPADPLSAITRLRRLLDAEVDPVERHFMFLDLEKLLYRSRDVFDSALTEFEQACRDHDAEMDRIVPILVDRLGGVPVLPTYKQAAVMKQKEKDFESALWWAERGLALYGSEGLSQNHVEDLLKRSRKYRAKLDAS